MSRLDQQFNFFREIDKEKEKVQLSLFKED